MFLNVSGRPSRCVDPISSKTTFSGTRRWNSVFPRITRYAHCDGNRSLYRFSNDNADVRRGKTLTLWFVSTFPLFATWGILCAYTLKIRFSGTEYFLAKFLLCLIFNGFFAITHLSMIEENNFPLLGYNPDLISNYPIIGWIAFFCIPAHAGALPVRWEIRWWF